jgi:hypothetical protein
MTTKAVFSDRYLRYQKLCVRHRLEAGKLEDLSGTDIVAARRLTETFTLLERGDGVSDAVYWVQFPDGTTCYLRRSDVKVVSGSLRSVPRRGRIRMGKTSLMGRLAAGIRSGRTFRGR